MPVMSRKLNSFGTAIGCTATNFTADHRRGVFADESRSQAPASPLRSRSPSRVRHAWREKLVKVYIGDLILNAKFRGMRVWLRLQYGDEEPVYSKKLVCSSESEPRARSSGLFMFTWRPTTQRIKCELPNCYQTREVASELKVELVKLGVVNRTLAAARIRVPPVLRGRAIVSLEDDLVFFNREHQELARLPTEIDVVDLTRQLRPPWETLMHEVAVDALKIARENGCDLVAGKPVQTLPAASVTGGQPPHEGILHGSSQVVLGAAATPDSICQM